MIENDVYEHVIADGFDDHAVVERGDAEDHLCLVAEGDGRSAVHYIEPGKRSAQVVLPSLQDAHCEVVIRLVTGARTSLNANFRLAHAEMDLPLPCEMD